MHLRLLHFSVSHSFLVPFEVVHRRRFFYFTRKVVPLLSHSICEKVFPYILTLPIRGIFDYSLSPTLSACQIHLISVKNAGYANVNDTVLKSGPFKNPPILHQIVL